MLHYTIEKLLWEHIAVKDLWYKVDQLSTALSRGRTNSTVRFSLFQLQALEELMKTRRLKNRAEYFQKLCKGFAQILRHL